MSVESTDVTFVVSCTYYQLSDALAKISLILGKDAGKYIEIRDNVRSAINSKYFDSTSFTYGASQTANALPLYLGIVPEGDEWRVAEHIADNAESNDYHLTAGEVGLKPVFNMLSEYGYSDYAYKMIMNPTSPSYFYFVSQGKTTLPEVWNGGASQNHCMAGHGESWLYEYLGGIRNDGIAYKNIIIAPYIAPELTSFNTSVKTVYGTIRSDWSKTENKTTIMNISIPANTSAKIYFPVKKAENIYENGIELTQAEGVKKVYTENETVVAEVGSGIYTFTMPTEKTELPSETKAIPDVTSAGGINPQYAVDGDLNTVFTVANQSESTAANQYIQFEFNGSDAISKIVIRKQLIDGSYWQDHALSVGCELQGSFDGNSWETVAVMNTWPDGTDSQSFVVFRLAEAKAYKYIRYVRTTVKKQGDYAYWLWSSTDGGNRLNIAEIEFYIIKPNIEAKITSVEGTNVSITTESNLPGEYTMIAAVYSNDGYLLSAASKRVAFGKHIALEINIDVKAEGEIAIFFLNDNLAPISERIKV